MRTVQPAVGRMIAVAVVTVVAGMTASTALAATSTFSGGQHTGSSKEYWSRTGNWDSVPVNANGSTTDLVFNVAGEHAANTNDFLTSVRNVTLGNTGFDYTISGTGSGATMSLYGDITDNGTSGTANTWNIGLTLTANATFTTTTSGATMTYGGAIANVGHTLKFDGAGSTFITNAISGTNGALTKTGAGTLTLSAANTYSGATDVQQGILNANVTNAIQNSASVSVSGGTLNVGATNAVGSSSQVNVSSGTLAIAGNNDTVAGVKLTGGSITGSTGVLTSTSNYDMQSGSASAILAGSVGLNKTTGSTVTLSGVNRYTGATTISDGVLSVNNLAAGGSNSAIGASTAAATNLVFDGGTLQYTAGNVSTNRNFTINNGKTATIDVSTAGTNLTLSGASTNTTGALTKIGSGTLTLTGANLYTGNTNVQAGTLAVGVNNAIGSSSHVYVSGGTLGVSTFNDTVAGLQLTGGASITGTTGVLTSTSAFDMQSGSVSAILGGTNIALNKTTSGTVMLSGANTYTGLTTVSDGTLAYGASNVISTGGVTVNGASAILDLGASHSDSVGTVTVDGGGRITGSGTSTLTSTGTFEMKNGSVSAILGGSVDLNKTTGNTVTLSGANTYTGNTNVQAGTLTVGVNNAIGSSSHVYVSGGTLGISTFNDTVAGVQLTNGASITGSSGVLTSNSTFDMQSGNVSAKLGGSVGLNKTTGGTVTLSAVNTYTGATTVSGGTLLVNGSIASTTPVAVSAGATLGGTGTIANGATFAGTAKLAPGTVDNTPGKLTLNGTTTLNSADLNIDIAKAGTAGAMGVNDGNAGTNWDVVKMGTYAQTGTLTVNLESFKGIGGVAGTPAGLGGGVGSYVYNWLIATATNTNAFSGTMNLIHTGFSPVAGIITGSQQWSLTTDTNKQNLYVHYSYSSVPEATTLLLGFAGMVPMLLQRRTRREAVAR